MRSHLLKVGFISFTSKVVGKSLAQPSTYMGFHDKWIVTDGLIYPDNEWLGNWNKTIGLITSMNDWLM
jgi:hypothetical protein